MLVMASEAAIVLFPGGAGVHGANANKSTAFMMRG